MENYKCYNKVFDPFPHLIIENTFDQEDLHLIWEEIDFLNQPEKISFLSAENNFVNTFKSIHLQKIFKLETCSSILNLNNNFINDELYTKISELNFGYNSIFFSKQYQTFLNYYDNDDSEKSHQDISLFTFLTCLHKEPKKFSGGKLIFDVFNYTVELKNNMTIVFPSFIHNSIDKIEMNKNFSYGDGQYIIKIVLSPFY